MNSLRVGVVGCGVLGSRHAEIYHGIEGVELVAVCDKHEDRAQGLAERFGAKATSDLSECFGQVDVASICTPAIHHYDVSHKLLDQGIHLLIEKPITTVLDEADKLIHLAQQKNLILQAGHIERYNGAVKAVKSIVKNPVFIECDRIGMFNPRIADVGVVLDLMIHDIDIMLYLVDSPIKSIQAVGMNVLSQTEDFANCRIEFENGAACSLTASRMAQKHLRKIRIFEGHQYVSLDYFRQEVLTFTKESAQVSETFYNPMDIRKTNPLEDEIKDFVACVRENRQPEVRGEEARNALAVALKILDQINIST